MERLVFLTCIWGFDQFADTNLAVLYSEPQKLARALDCTIYIAKNKGADQLAAWLQHTADLCMRKECFLIT